jgi:hypothetical protein
MSPVKEPSELEASPILHACLGEIASPLEDRGQVGVHDRQIGRPHFDLLQLVGCLVEHFELEVHPAEFHGEGEIVWRTREGFSIHRDHAGGPIVLTIHPLQSRQDGQARLALQRALPRSHRLAPLAEARLGVAQGHRGGNKVPRPAERVLQMGDGGGGTTALEILTRPRVMKGGQPVGFGRTLVGGHRVDEPLLGVDGFRRLARGQRHLSQAAQGRRMGRSFSQNAPVKGHCLVGPARLACCLRLGQPRLDLLRIDPSPSRATEEATEITTEGREQIEQGRGGHQDAESVGGIELTRDGVSWRPAAPPPPPGADT